jgi:hypothetical protein
MPTRHIGDQRLREKRDERLSQLCNAGLVDG